MYKKCQHIVNYKRDIISIYRMNISYMVSVYTYIITLCTMKSIPKTKT